MDNKPIKNIIIVGPAHPYRGGIAAFNERMAQELCQSSIHTKIWTFTMQYPTILFPGKTQYSNSPAPEGIHILRKIHSLNPFNWINLGLQLRRRQPDILILRYWMPFFAPMLTILARLCGTKTILLADNIVPHESRIGDRLLSNILLSSVDATMVLSKSVADDVRAIRPQMNILHLPHPIFNQYGDASERAKACNHLQLDDSKKYLLFFGFIREYKGLDLLLEALKIIDTDLPDVELIVAGEFYGDEHIYRSMVEALGIKNKCHFYNSFIPDEEVNYFFSASDVLVLPYKSATQSGVTQIAYHFEIPMIATQVGGLSEYIDHNVEGLLCDTHPQSIAESIRNFYQNKKRGFMVESIKKSKSRFTWQSFNDKLIAFCKTL